MFSDRFDEVNMMRIILVNIYFVDFLLPKMLFLQKLTEKSQNRLSAKRPGGLSFWGIPSWYLAEMEFNPSRKHHAILRSPPARLLEKSRFEDFGFSRFWVLFWWKMAKIVDFLHITRRYVFDLGGAWQRPLLNTMLGKCTETKSKHSDSALIWLHVLPATFGHLWWSYNSDQGNW